MRTYIFVILFCFTFYSFSNLITCHAIEQASTSITDCPNEEHFYERAICIKKKLIQSDNAREKEECFKILMGYWANRDGARGYTLSDIFLELLEADANFFFSQMVKHPNQFDEWLNRLRYLSFTWHQDPPSPLPQKKESILQLLKNYNPEKKELKELKEKLENKLITVVPRQIQ